MDSKYIDISVDIESWGTEPGDDIRSIGAVVFYPYVPAPMSIGASFYVACDNPLVGTYSKDHHSQFELDLIDGPHRLYNLKRNPKTVKWWHDREDIAKTAFVNAIDLKMALMKLSEFILTHSKDIREGQARDVRIWCHGANFDPGMLEAACRACGLPVPWFYRAPRDTRTIFDDAGIYDHSAHLEKHRVGVLHHALHDSTTQALAIGEAATIIAKNAHDTAQRSAAESFVSVGLDGASYLVFRNLSAAVAFFDRLGVPEDKRVLDFFYGYENAIQISESRTKID